MARKFHLIILAGMLALAGSSRLITQPVIAFKVPSAKPVAQRLPRPDASLRRAGFSGPHDAKVTRIIDGDTFEARVRIWFGQEITTLVRIRGIDAPELKSRCASEAARASLATEALADYLSPGGVRLTEVGLDKYGGRVLANVMANDPALPGEAPVDVASLMLSSGLARPYDGGKRASWCDLAGIAD